MGQTRASRRFQIVVGLDRSEYAEIVLEHALDQVARHDAPDLHVLTVVDTPADVEATKQRMAALVLPALEDFDCTDWQLCLHVRVGKAHEEIAGLAAERRANLIVVGRFGLHHHGTRLGSVASRVLEAATCPTLVVGMVDDSPDVVAQCPNCVTLRAESEGERWFCAVHAANDRARFAAGVVSGPTWTGGGLMW
jgi:nucleotide-binding universal stress UspA family protein